MGRGRQDRIRNAWDELQNLLNELEYMVSTVIVEGLRDVKALRELGFKGQIDVCSQLSVSEPEFSEILSRNNKSVLLLTDYDEEGKKINRHLTKLLERQGVKVEVGLRRQFGRTLAAIGIYAIEDLDNSAYRVQDI